MPAATRLGDLSTGHGSWPPRANDTASPNVFINGIAAHRVNDHWPTHCNSTPECHDGVLSSGSTNVFVNGLALARVGDVISCGDFVAQGSTNVFVN